jgi:hypothetical protein
MTLHRFADRCALVGCGLVSAAALAWLVFHPAAAGALQIAMIAMALVWRARLSHIPPASRP